MCGALRRKRTVNEGYGWVDESYGWVGENDEDDDDDENNDVFSAACLFTTQYGIISNAVRCNWHCR